MRRTLLRLAAIAAAQGIAALALAATPAPAKTDATHLSLAERIDMATQMHSAITTYFAHWQAIPEEDFERDFRHYLDAISRSDDRRAFDLATLELFGKLRNGHTSFNDDWLWRTDGDLSSGLRVAYRRGRWVVLDSRRPAIPPGSVIVSIDGWPIEAFYALQGRYLNASNERARRDRLFNTGYLFPRTFTLGLADGRRVRVNRKDPGQPWHESKPPTDLPKGVYYTSIASFGEAKSEQDALAFVKQHADAQALIIDLRGNSGGTTPGALIKSLMDRPYLDWSDASAMSVGLLKAYGELADKPETHDNPELHGYAEGMRTYFTQPMMLWPGRLQKPDHPVYTGKLIVLTDGVCGSACEDFVMPLKVSGRAIVVGEATQGSSGQPYLHAFGNGMSFRVGAKRMSFGDGAPFEGVGIQPDVEVIATPEQLRAGADPVLDRAIELSRSS